ncbi:MAG TPA: hypothetical protein PLC54_06765 [Spirochaetales bacterium]|nr:hypothetical protein [Spirochaetales bacterium]
MKRLLISLVALCFLASCVGIDAETRIAADGSVELSIRYDVPQAVDQFGRLDANAEYLPLPIGRPDLELAASRAGGTLKSWNRSDSETGAIIKAELRFPSPLAFARFMDPQLQLARFTESAGVKTLSMQLNSAEPTDPDWSAFLRTAFGELAIRLQFTLPAAALSSSGLTVSGRSLSFSKAAADIYASDQPTIISFSWK